MNRMLSTIATAVALTLTGCNKAETPAAPASSPVLEPWQIERDKLQAAIKIGMTQDEVVKAAGEPKRVRSTYSSMPIILWQYELASNRWFNVRFGKDERVVSAELGMPAKVQ